MLDLSALPVVDVHCHPFSNAGQLTPDGLVDAIAFPGGGVAYMAQGGAPVDDALRQEIQGVRRSTLYFHYAVRALAAFFGCEATLEAVSAQRNQAVQADYPGYVQRLFAHCQLATLVPDFGYPQPPMALTAFRQDVGIPVVPIYRIEPLIAQLLKTDIGWSEFKQRYDDAIAHALQHEGYRGVKSIIAYRTGLAVSPLSRTADQGLQALDAIRRGTGDNAMKKLRDHLLCRALELCMEHEVPMQIHTGMGDYEVNLVQCRPALLLDLLRFPTFRTCRVLLVHGGYPYQAEAGYMANMLPRLYCDVSEGIPFAGHAAKRIYLEVLEMAPLNKVVYGSDGFTCPETYYVGAVLGKQALTAALQELVQSGFLAVADAAQAGAQILADNARTLYRL